MRFPQPRFVAPLFVLTGLLALACSSEVTQPTDPVYDVVALGRGPGSFMVSAGCTPLGPEMPAQRLVLVSTQTGPAQRFECGTLPHDSVRAAVEQYWAQLPPSAGHAQTEAEGHLMGEALDWWEAQTPYGSPAPETHYLWYEVSRACCTGVSGVPHQGDGFFLDITPYGSSLQEEHLELRVNGDEIWHFNKLYDQLPDFNDEYWICWGQTNCVPADSGGEGGEGGGGEGGGGEVITFTDDDAVDMARPTCPAVRGEYGSDEDFKKGKMWCNGSSVKLNATRKARVLAATARIRAKGGDCVVLANVIDSVLQHDDIRTDNVGGAFAQVNGGVNGWMYIRSLYIDYHYDSDHPFIDATVGPIDLQWFLAHEADHLLGNVAGADAKGHVGNALTTPNSVQCGR